MRSALLATFSVLSMSFACAGQAPPSSPAAGQEPGSTPATVSAAPAAADSPEPTTDGKTRFTFVLPKPGSERVDRESFVLGLEITMTEGAKVIATEKSGEGKSKLRHTTVMANDGRAITKKKVRYEELNQIVKKGDREQRIPSPLTGKSYVISLEQGKVLITAADSKAVSDVEREALLEDNKEFGKPPQFASFVPKHPLAPGEKFTPPKEVLAEMFGAGDGAGDKSYGDVEFTFVGAEERAGKKVGKFEFTMTITDSRQGATTTIQAKGAVLLLLDSGWPLELVLRGQVTVSAPGDKPKRKVAGKGLLEMKIAAEYR